MHFCQVYHFTAGLVSDQFSSCSLILSVCGETGCIYKQKSTWFSGKLHVHVVHDSLTSFRVSKSFLPAVGHRIYAPALEHKCLACFSQQQVRDNGWCLPMKKGTGVDPGLWFTGQNLKFLTPRYCMHSHWNLFARKVFFRRKALGSIQSWDQVCAEGLNGFASRWDENPRGEPCWSLCHLAARKLAVFPSFLMYSARIILGMFALWDRFTRMKHTQTCQWKPVLLDM